MAFRYSEVDPVYLDDDGNPCAGGSLTYTRTGTSTAHNVYSDAGLGTSLGNVITLDSSGRAPDHWLDASTYAYRRVLKNAAGEEQGSTRDNIREIDTAGVSVPDPSGGNDGEVPMIDAGEYVLTQVADFLVPDPTGQSGKQLGTDGELIFWEEKPTAATYDEDNLPGGFEDNTSSGYFDAGAMRQVWGNDTAPTVAALITSKAVTFPAPFADTSYRIVVTATCINVTSNSPSGTATCAVTNKSTTGCTVYCFVGEENTGGTDTINSNVTFDYYAVGLKP